jgi:hypothetical protein
MNAVIPTLASSMSVDYENSQAAFFPQLSYPHFALAVDATFTMSDVVR